jgi:cytoskeleton protein RodZ
MAEIGSTLREARMRARIDIGEVELRTKIRAKYLRAIENEEWDLLPGPVYAKSFLKTYGDYLGLDSRMLIDEFKRRYERPTDHELRPMSSITRERERAVRGPLISPRWIIGFVLVVVVAALYLIGRGSSNPSKPSPTGATGSHSHHRHHAGGTASTTTTPTTAVLPSIPKVVRLQLVPTGQVYVCVENGAGKVLIPGATYDTGQTIPVVRGGTLLMTLGNNAVQMKVNGKPYTVPASTGPTDLKVTPTRVAPLPATQAPTCP